MVYTYVPYMYVKENNNQKKTYANFPDYTEVIWFMINSH